MPGKKALRQLLPWAVGNPAGHITTKPGRLWFSVPRPYNVQAPMLGTARLMSPQFIMSRPGSWFGTSV